MALKGIFPVLCTPFDEEEAVDEPSLRRLIDFVLGCSVSGVVVGGIASETMKLSSAERHRIIRITMEHVAGRVPVIVGASHDGTRAAVQLAEEAEEMGATSVMVMPPVATRPSLASVAEYYVAIARALGIPVMIQDAPMISGILMPAPFIADLVSRHPTLSLIKIEAPPTGPKITAVSNAAGPNLSIFAGLGGGNLLEELERGAVGSLPGSAFPDVHVRIYDAFQSGGAPAARPIYLQHMPLLSYTGQSIEWSYHAHKHVLWRRGVIRTPVVRRPTVAFDSVAAANLVAIINVMWPGERGDARRGQQR